MAQGSILVAQESILVPQESILIDFSYAFQCFWPATAATAAGTARAQRGHSRQHRSGTARRTPQGRIQESFFPLEEPYSETLLGKNGLFGMGTETATKRCPSLRTSWVD